MKIISKFKDFYDFKVSKYGVDEKLVFDRREPVVVSKDTLTPNGKIENVKDNEALHSIMYVGNNIIHIFGTRDKIYTHFDMVDDKELELLSYDRISLTFNDGKKINIISEFISYGQSLKEIMEIKREDNPLKKIRDFHYIPYITVNSKDMRKMDTEDRGWNQFKDKEIILIQRIRNKEMTVHRRTNSEPVLETIYTNPPLNVMGLYIDPDWMWQSLVEFLSIKKGESEHSPKMSDEAKIQSKGFDKKTSFRPKMKKC